MFKTLLWVLLLVAALIGNAMTPSGVLQRLQVQQYYRVAKSVGPQQARVLWLGNIRAYRKLVSNVPSGERRQAQQGNLSGMGMSVGDALSNVTSVLARGVRRIVYSLVFFTWPRLYPMVSWLAVAAFVAFLGVTFDGLMVRSVRRYDWNSEVSSPMMANAGRWLMWLGSVLLLAGLLLPTLINVVVWVESAGWVIASLGWITRISQIPRSI